MFSNCRSYNQPETVYFKCANELEDYIKPHLNSFIDGTLEINEMISKKMNHLNNGKKKI